ncbi:hypothetical protein NC652_021035 [Populus alba x Populus x berolinensis]|nr:hypothetical protein NC652_021035 [Populus alba x Populus x berolinensis]
MEQQLHSHIGLHSLRLVQELAGREESSRGNSATTTRDICYIVDSRSLLGHNSNKDNISILSSPTLNIVIDISIAWPLAFLLRGWQRCNNEFEDAGHSRSARELLETFFIGELDLSATVIPELEISSKKQADCTQKLKDLTKQYWGVPVAVIGVSAVVGFLYLRKK